MMGFKDDFLSDIQDTFLCEDEFAENHIIDGVEMSASIDDIELSRRDRRASGSHEDGFHKKSKLLYVAASDFGNLPATNRILTVDGRKYIVKDAKNEDGMYSIFLEVMRA